MKLSKKCPGYRTGCQPSLPPSYRAPVLKISSFQHAKLLPSAVFWEHNLIKAALLTAWICPRNASCYDKRICGRSGRSESSRKAICLPKWSHVQTKGIIPGTSTSHLCSLLPFISMSRVVNPLADVKEAGLPWLPMKFAPKHWHSGECELATMI